MAKVEKLDHFGRGIVFDNKITFINYALPNEEVEYHIIKQTKKYNVANIDKIVRPSEDRINYPCPYFLKCGGCSLQHLKYAKTLEFKKAKVEEILNKYANIKTNIEVISNSSPYHYRNKLSLKIKDNHIGFYEEKTHELVEIKECLLAKEAINKLILDLKYFHLTNANVTIRASYNDELMIIITTNDEPKIDLDYLTHNHKIVGIIINYQIYYGEDKFIEIINKQLFQVSYNSFFQVNPFINAKILKIVQDNIKKNSIVADLFCGVGSLGITASLYAQKVYGIEIVPNAIKNALINKKINHRENIDFCLGDANKVLMEIKDNIDTIILDPPRSGLKKEGKDTLLKIKPDVIIYISCDPMTLARDLKELTKVYEVKKFYIADMFSNTYHVESICILNILKEK